jgi:hypothetical protein
MSQLLCACAGETGMDWMHQSLPLMMPTAPSVSRYLWQTFQHGGTEDQLQGTGLCSRMGSSHQASHALRVLVDSQAEGRSHWRHREGLVEGMSPMYINT